MTSTVQTSPPRKNAGGSKPRFDFHATGMQESRGKNEAWTLSNGPRRVKKKRKKERKKNKKEVVYIVLAHTAQNKVSVVIGIEKVFVYPFK